MTSQLQRVSNLSNPIRPPRLNSVGWCFFCVRRWCEDPKCIAWHRNSIWGPCDRCGGTGSTGLANCLCTDGLIEFNTQDEADQAWMRADSVPSPLDQEPAVVVTSPREAAGLVLRTEVPPELEWDYAAGCPKSISGARSFRDGLR